MAFVSVTRLHLASKWRFPVFIAYSLSAARQARRTPGFLGGWLGTDADGGFWTVTVWQGGEAMRAFRNGGVHFTVMPKLMRWADEAHYTHWEQTDTSIPSSDLAYEQLSRSGTASKLRTPSARHVAGQRVGRAKPRIAQKLAAAT